MKTATLKNFNGKLDKLLIQNRYSSMRRYFADFIRLPFLVEKGGQPLEQSIDLVRKLDQQKIMKIPSDMDTKFMDSQLTIAMRDSNGEIKRNLWEIGLAIAIKDGFRSGDLYVEHSNKYASFWNLIYQLHFKMRTRVSVGFENCQ